MIPFHTLLALNKQVPPDYTSLFIILIINNVFVIYLCTSWIIQRALIIEVDWPHLTFVSLSLNSTNLHFKFLWMNKFNYFIQQLRTKYVLMLN